MLAVKFNSYPNKIYECKKYEIKEDRITLFDIESYPEDPQGGFKIYKYTNKEKTEVILEKDFSDYSVVWEKKENVLVLSNDKRVYNTYFLYSVDGFIISEITTPDKMRGSVLLIDSGVGREHKNYPHIPLYDEDNFYLYKVVNKKKVPTTAQEKEKWNEERDINKLKKAKEEKKKIISQDCKNMILKGVELNGSRFSYTVEDQNNIYNCMNLAIKTGLSVPYHADGESCRLFTKDELLELYYTQELNVTHHTTYNNQLKLYIDDLKTIEEIKAIQYGITELTGKYLESYNEMMTQAEEILRAITELNN